MNLRTIIIKRKKALKASKPEHRNKLRHKYHVALKAQQIRKECA